MPSTSRAARVRAWPVSAARYSGAAQDVHRILPFSRGRRITLDGPGAALNKPRWSLRRSPPKTDGPQIDASKTRLPR